MYQLCPFLQEALIHALSLPIWISVMCSTWGYSWRRFGSCSWSRMQCHGSIVLCFYNITVLWIALTPNRLTRMLPSISVNLLDPTLCLLRGNAILLEKIPGNLDSPNPVSFSQSSEDLAVFPDIWVRSKMSLAALKAFSFYNWSLLL